MNLGAPTFPSTKIFYNLLVLPKIGTSPEIKIFHDPFAYGDGKSIPSALYLSKMKKSGRADPLENVAEYTNGAFFNDIPVNPNFAENSSN